MNFSKTVFRSIELYTSPLRVISQVLIAYTTFATVALSQNGNACSTMAQMAETIMTARQRDVPLATVMALLDELTAADPGSSEAMRSVVLVAYMQPIRSSDEERAEMVSTFRLAIELKCHGVSKIE